MSCVSQVLSWSKMASDRMATPQSSSRQSSSLSSSPMRQVAAQSDHWGSEQARSDFYAITVGSNEHSENDVFKVLGSVLAKSQKQHAFHSCPRWFVAMGLVLVYLLCFWDIKGEGELEFPLCCSMHQKMTFKFHYNRYVSMKLFLYAFPICS